MSLLRCRRDRRVWPTPKVFCTEWPWAIGLKQKVNVTGGWPRTAAGNKCWGNYSLVSVSMCVVLPAIHRMQHRRRVEPKRLALLARPVSHLLPATAPPLRAPHWPTSEAVFAKHTFTTRAVSIPLHNKRKRPKLQTLIFSARSQTHTNLKTRTRFRPFFSFFAYDKDR